MLQPLIRSNIGDGTIAADSTTTNTYVGGAPAGLRSVGAYGTLSDTRYVGIMKNDRATDVANGKCTIYFGANKMKIWKGISGTDTSADATCPFDTTVTWAIGDQLYIRNMATYAQWSNVNYNSGISHGVVTKAPASATDTMEAWFIERTNA